MQSGSRGGEGAGKSLARSSGKALASSAAPCTVGSVQVVTAGHLWHGWGKKERRVGGGPVFRYHHPGYSPGKTLLSLSSEQCDLLPESLCSAGPATSLHTQPGLQQCNFHGKNA